MNTDTWVPLDELRSNGAIRLSKFAIWTIKLLTLQSELQPQSHRMTISTVLTTQPPPNQSGPSLLERQLLLQSCTGGGGEGHGHKTSQYCPQMQSLFPGGGGQTPLTPASCWNTPASQCQAEMRAETVELAAFSKFKSEACKGGPPKLSMSHSLLIERRFSQRGVNRGWARFLE